MKTPVPLYCIDTSAFSRAWHVNYSPDNFPSLWKEFDGAIQAGLFLFPEQVYEELQYQKDALSNWVKPLKKHLYYKVDDLLLAEQIRISNAYPKLVQPTKSGEVADPYVVGLAKLKGLTVVTDEGGKRFKMPDVCLREEVPVMSFAQMVRAFNWKF